MKSFNLFSLACITALLVGCGSGSSASKPMQPGVPVTLTEFTVQLMVVESTPTVVNQATQEVIQAENGKSFYLVTANLANNTTLDLTGEALEFGLYLDGEKVNNPLPSGAGAKDLIDAGKIHPSQDILMGETVMVQDIYYADENAELEFRVADQNGDNAHAVAIKDIVRPRAAIE